MQPFDIHSHSFLLTPRAVIYIYAKLTFICLFGWLVHNERRSVKLASCWRHVPTFSVGKFLALFWWGVCFLLLVHLVYLLWWRPFVAFISRVVTENVLQKKTDWPSITIFGDERATSSAARRQRGENPKSQADWSHLPRPLYSKVNSSKRAWFIGPAPSLSPSTLVSFCLTLVGIHLSCWLMMSSISTNRRR